MRYILWIASALLIGAYITPPLGDPDLWWHITVGRWILSHGIVPVQDYWNLFGAGMAWRAYSWSNEVVYALVDRHLGLKGLVFLQLLLAIVMAGSFQWLFSRIARDSWFGVLLGSLVAVACFGHFSLRPQVVVWIVFAVVLSLCSAIVEEGISRTRLFLLAACGCVWANSHLTSVLGVGVIALWCIQSNRGEVSWRRALVACGAFFIGTLVTPYIGGEWLTFLSKSGHPLKFRSIDEFQPATVMQYVTVFPLLLTVFLVVVSNGTRIFPPVARIIAMGGFLLGGLAVIKFLPFAVIVLASGVGEWWYRLQTSPAHAPRDNLSVGLLLLWERSVRLAPETCGAVAFALLSLGVVNVVKVWKAPFDEARIPRAAVDFIEHHGLPRPVANDFGSGGYLMYRFSTPEGSPINPQSLVTVDGRTNVNPPDIWELYQKSFMGRVGWREYLDRSSAQTVMWRQPLPLVALLLESQGWCHVFGDLRSSTDYVVFLRRDVYTSRFSQLPSGQCRSE